MHGAPFDTRFVDEGAGIGPGIVYGVGLVVRGEFLLFRYFFG